MDPGGIPHDVLRFLADSIDSVPHLEALLLLWEHPGKAWTEDEVAQRIYISTEAARAILHDLGRRRFTVTESGDQQGHGFKYDSSWDHPPQIMPRVSDSYRRHLVGIANFIHSKASVAVHDFARAFQFKGD